MATLVTGGTGFVGANIVKDLARTVWLRNLSGKMRKG